MTFTLLKTLIDKVKSFFRKDKVVYAPDVYSYNQRGFSDEEDDEPRFG